MRVEDEIRISRESCCRDRRMRTRGYFMLFSFFLLLSLQRSLCTWCSGKKEKEKEKQFPQCCFIVEIHSVEICRSLKFLRLLRSWSFIFFFFFVQTRVKF